MRYVRGRSVYGTPAARSATQTGKPYPLTSAVAFLGLSWGTKPFLLLATMIAGNPDLRGACGQKRAERDKQHNAFFHIVSRVLSMESRVETNLLRLWEFAAALGWTRTASSSVGHLQVNSEMLVLSVRWRTKCERAEAIRGIPPRILLPFPLRNAQGHPSTKPLKRQRQPDGLSLVRGTR